MKKRLLLPLLTLVLTMLLLTLPAAAADIPEAQKYGGDMVSVFGGTSPTMDVHSSNAGSLYHSRWSLHVWEGLLAADANGKTYPLICDYTVSADGCTYTLTLRDRHFSNGKKITMDDIEASLRRYVAMNYTTRSGYEKYWKGTTWKINGNTITFQTEQFNIYFESILKSLSSSFKIMPKEICEKWSPDWTTGTYDPATGLTWGCTKVNEITNVKDIIGSGPYKLQSYLGNSAIVLARNENYEPITEGNEDAIGAAAPRMAYFDTITFKVSTDTATNTAATLAGEFHNGSVQADMWDAALSMGLKRWDAGTSWTHGIFFNLHESNADSPIADVNVRKAIRAIIDSNAILLAVTGRQERVVLDPYSVMKSNAYYSSNIMEEKGDYNIKDPVKAKAYLAQSDYNGEPIKYLFHASGNFYKAAMAAIPMMESIGLNVEAMIVDNGSHTAMRKNPATGHDIGCWEVQKNEENPVLHSTFVTGTQGWWSSPAKDAAIAIMKTTPTGSKESVAAYNDYLQAVVDEVPYILFGHVVGYLWTAPNYVSDMAGQTNYYWNNYFTDNAPKLPAPTLTVTLNSSDKPYLKWSAVDGAEKYNVYRAVKGGSYELLYSTTKTSMNNTNAVAGKTYYYKVAAVANGKEGTLSGYKSVTVPKEEIVLTAPTLTVTLNSSDKPYLKWSAVDGAEKYNVYRAVKGGSYELLYSTTKTSMNNTNAVAGKTYYYKVAAVADGTEGPLSGYKSVTVPKAVTLTAPTGLSVTLAGSMPVISWNAVEGAESYNVYRAVKGGSYVSIAQNSATAVVDTSTQAGKTYYYKVAAVANGKDGPLSGYKSVTVPKQQSVLTAPTLTVTLNSSDKPYLKWSAVDGAEKYNIYRAEKGGSYELLYTTTKTSMNNSNAVESKTYYYKVAAVAGTIEGTLSGYKSVTVPKQEIVLTAPTLTVTLNSSDKPYLKWSAVDGAEKYNVYRAVKGGSYEFLYSTTKTSMNNTNAVAGKTYYYKVAAVANGKEGPLSGYKSITVPSAGYQPRVIIGQNVKTTTTVPQNQTNIAHRMMFNLTHNTLVGYVEKDKELQPELAKSWTVSDDLKTWTFALRNDVVFHNGEKFTADDVVYTYQRAMSAAGVSGTVKAAYAAFESVKANSDYEVVITLKEGNIDLLYTLSNEYMAILNREACTADPTNGGSIGTGAWINKEFVSGDHTTLEVNEKYWAEVPVTKVLEFRYISEGSARLIALETGEIDVCQTPNNTEHEIIKANKDLTLEAYPSSALTYLAFNMDTFLGEDENLRLAIAYALDLDPIMAVSTSGFSTPSNSMWGIGQYGYFDDWASVGQTPYNNTEKAKEYMAKSKYASTGVDIKFMTTTLWRVNALLIMQEQLKELGINVIIDEVDAESLAARSNSGDFEVLMYSITFTPAGSDVNRILYPGSFTNFARYNNARVTELLELASAEQDDTKRKAYYQEVQEIVHKEAPYIPLYYANSGVAYDKNLESTVFNNSGNHDYTYARVPA